MKIVAPLGRIGLVATLAVVVVSFVQPNLATAHDGAGQASRTVVAAGYNHTCAARNDATVWCWGNNNNGAVTGTPGAAVPTPVAVPGVAGAVSVAAGYEFSCALLTTGGVECWGNNAFGQLGNGSTGGNGAPSGVVGLTDAVAISAGTSTACALRASGAVRCWGYGDHGALGNGAKSDSNAPVDVGGLKNATEVSVGSSFACARQANGSVRCWGQGTQGELGDGNGADSTVPVSVSGVTSAKTVSAGSNHACAIIAGSSVVCWGGNAFGGLGDGSNGTSLVPVAVQFDPKLVAVSVGMGFTCGTNFAQLLCWGENSDGQLGVGNTSPSYSPLGVNGSGTYLVATGAGHTCIATSSIKCWGANTFGQLGDGTLNPSLIPPTKPIVGIQVDIGVRTLQTVTPERILDTRSTSPIGYSGAKPDHGATVVVQVTGVGKTKLRSGTPAAALNITGTDATAPGFVTVWPCDQPLPVASTLNLVPGEDRANAMITRLSATGTVCLYTQSGTHLLVDLNGDIPATVAYVPAQPVRLLDTRPTSPTGYVGAKPGPGSIVTLHVTGRQEIAIPTGASTAVLNVTAVDATNDGYVTVWPCDEPRPNASNLNLRRNETIPVGVIAKLSALGTVCLYTQSGTNLLADVNGWMPPGGTMKPISPLRVLDTRPTSLIGYVGPKPADNQTVKVSLAAVPELVTATSGSVVLSVTATDATGDAFITAWSCIGPPPATSNLNVPGGGTRPNLVIVTVSSSSEICVTASRSTHLIVDVNAWIPNTPTTTTDRGFLPIN
jgi:alpha-tubulin suppressor-like RCC1 family protein